MAEIRQFKTRAQKMKDFLQELIQHCEEEEIEKICFAGTSKKDGSFIFTAYHNCDLGDKQVLNSHIQIDIVDQTIQANINRYIELI